MAQIFVIVTEISHDALDKLKNIGYIFSYTVFTTL